VAVDACYLRHQTLVATRLSSLIQMLAHSAMDIDAFADIEKSACVVEETINPAATWKFIGCLASNME
jgi:hypothetical protein